MRVLVACESSGTVRDAFIRHGHDAMSCDLSPTKRPGPHYQGDVRNILHRPWDLLISHPPCTYLCRAGLHWNAKRPGRAELTREALEFATEIIDGNLVAHIPLRAMENPIGLLSSHIGMPNQVLQPWQFGDDASKATCLWLRGGLPELQHTGYVAPRVFMYGGQWVMRWANQSDSGQNNVTAGPKRGELRSVTYPGVGEAMADQWGKLKG